MDTKMKDFEYTPTMPYDIYLNIFNPDLKEVFELIGSGTIRQVNQLLGFNPNLSLENHFYQKYTPLMQAVYLGKMEMVEHICKIIKTKYSVNNNIQSQYKKYLNQVSIDGKNALMIAVLTNDKTDIIKLLISEGADIYAKDKEANDIFYYAALAGTDEIEDFINTIKPK
jgi:ankyrin repeat protein